MQGLSPEMQGRMRQWRFATPCKVTLNNILMPAEHMQAGIEAALVQLSALHAGSRVQVCIPDRWFDDWQDTYGPVAGAIAAAAPALPHLVIAAPVLPGDDESVSAMCDPALAVKHAMVKTLKMRGGVAGTLWPWQSLGVRRELPLMQVLALPDPCVSGGQYDIELHGSEGLRINTEQVRFPRH